LPPEGTSRGDVDAQSAARQLHAQLSDWLTAQALPRWAQAGYDAVNGGFQERLTAEGPLPADSRRARVQVRQVYVFANARLLGWSGDPQPLVAGGLQHFLRYYRRADGLFRCLCAPGGRPLDERAFLYDQAFVLLALAESHKVLGHAAHLGEEAGQLHAALERLLRRGGPGFYSGVPERLPLLANPHMHLLEAALAWREISNAPSWAAQLVAELTDLALDHFIDPATGALLERFAEDWRPVPADAQLVEPGHLFEWSWLLQRCGGGRAQQAAARLIHVGEQHGVHRGITINALRQDLSVADAEARLWPQTERLKANARLAVSEPRCWPAAVEAAAALLRYLSSAPPGLWHDRLTPKDQFVEEPAPASSFYHIVAAISELGAAVASLRQSGSRRR
jgi:mannose/cellobiose epimerase-like protein (N-acyl-D-glucosamine 2-epimerase family)